MAADIDRADAQTVRRAEIDRIKKTRRAQSAAMAAIARAQPLLAYRALGYAPLVRFLLVIQMPNARDVRSVPVLLRPFDCFALRFEGGEDMIRVILNHIIVDRAALGRPFGRGST